MYRPLKRASICILLMLALFLVACGGSNNTMPTAQQIISNAQTAILKVSSYHFNLNVDNPGTGGVLIVKSADGDILVPDKLKATAKALVLGNVVQVQLVSIGDKQYVTDPITSQWGPTRGLLDPRTLSDSKTGVASILGHIQNPSTPTDDSVDGTSCWKINGKLDTQYLAGITGGSAPAGFTVDTTACIRKSDNLPYLIILTGIASKGDYQNTRHTFKLSKFNESLTITAPI